MLNVCFVESLWSRSTIGSNSIKKWKVLVRVYVNSENVQIGQSETGHPCQPLPSLEET